MSVAFRAIFKIQYFIFCFVHFCLSVFCWHCRLRLPITFCKFAMCGILEYKIVCHYKHKPKIQFFKLNVSPHSANLLLATGFSVVTVRVHGCPRDRHTKNLSTKCNVVCRANAYLKNNLNLYNQSSRFLRHICILY